ncbi:hypothetical protein [Mangrovicoccus sp. HB161399]|uniref:hypothetical protein n=1 Tax=Mangrovicoccus sp. HB161399 TaxID=2720392 RepID=UPI00155664D5|nr:hypothetical protein [Mangrovicoccus sp. HB161399]
MNSSAFAFALAMAPLATQAAEITLNAPFAGGTVSGALTDMSVYYTQAEDGAFTVVATYLAKDAAAQPARLMMEMQDGDALRFGLPGHPGELYSIERDGSDVHVRAAAADWSGRAS